ncbi:ABC-2 type transport system ATP-binding protein [Mobilisporobacter senegalensis]|uniref:ABC-2 type transport system ATP-binding protein n=1 Tax=Mobilisporobacter senegalensis TaxID=1329262 RepID=A0A3N1XF14_9FIRM|nr:ABC transporter ATP-binding protein [Mobilisporobacter senegalensis]ROR25326.1 ABC-2 type transport system ATP-binding protein [Mobilisporobacter senegalensis]
MIEAVNVSKQFDKIKAVDQITATIREGNVFGLVGTNGAGKSTFLRMLSGILKPDSGSIKIDGMDVYENIKAKELFFYISDDQYFFSNATPKDLKTYYQIAYSGFDGGRFDNLMKQFELDQHRKINTFSKGMKKQVSIICGICANTKYIFCDETFDGLDPVMRQAVKSIFAKEITERNMTPVIASHNLRELEDICDHVGLLHKGGILFSKDLFDMKLSIHKVQCVFQNEVDINQVFENIELLKTEKRGSLYTITARGTSEEITKRIAMSNPVFSEVLPLTLEEIFISETEVVGYDIKKLIL